MRDTHRVNASGACSVWTPQAVTRGDFIGNFALGGGVAISTVELSDRSAMPAARLAFSSHTPYLIPRDVA